MIGARACKFKIKEKFMFIPRGRVVPSLKVSCISSFFFRWMLLPVQSLIPRISASDKVWSKPLKCSGVIRNVLGGFDQFPRCRDQGSDGTRCFKLSCWNDS